MSFVNTADNSKWRVHVCALDGSTPSGSGPCLNISDKDFTYILNAGRQMKWSMTLDNPRVPWILNNDTLAKVYRRNRLGTWQLMMVGDILSMEETSSGDIAKLTCIAADPFWRLNQRWIGIGVNSGTGQGVPYQDPATLGSTIDLSTLLQNLINTANAQGNTGIALGSVTATGINDQLGPIYAQQIAPTIQQVCATSGGPDYEIVPQEPSGAWPSTVIGVINIQPHIGSLATPPVFFEYGMGKNTIASYQRIVSKRNIANEVISLPQGYPTLSAANDTVLTASDSTSQGARGLFQYVDSSGIVSPSLRQALINEDLSIMKQPQNQVSITPVANCPLDFGVDYFMGDVVGARAFDRQTKTIRFDGTLRLYGIEIATDPNDLEQVTLTTTPDSGSGTQFPTVPSGAY